MKKTSLFCVTAICLCLLTSCGGSQKTDGGLELLSNYGGASLYRTTAAGGEGHIRVAQLSGSFYAMGRQYGFLLGQDLAVFYGDIIEGYLIGEKGFAYEDLEREGEASFATMMPEMKEFVRGVAETSGLSLSRVKIINNSMLAAIYGCSAVAAWGEYTGGGPLVVGRNWDMVPLDRFKDYMTVVVYNPTEGNSVADINYLGQFQYFQSAMNDKGLWIDLQDGHMASMATDDSLQDPNSAILEFLLNDSTMEELDASFMAGPASASFIMTAASKDVAYSYFWCTQGVYRFEEDDQSGLISTSNHFVEYPDTWTIDPLPPDPAAQAYTELRRENWLELANSPTYRGLLDDGKMKTMLETTIPDGGGSFPTTGYPVETVYQIVAVPEDLLLWIRLPKYYGWERVDLKNLFD